MFSILRQKFNRKRTVFVSKALWELGHVSYTIIDPGYILAVEGPGWMGVNTYFKDGPRALRLPQYRALAENYSAAPLGFGE